MAKKQLSDAFKNAHGQLHRDLGVPQGKKIPEGKLERAANSGGKTAKRAQAALNMERARARGRRG